MERASVLIDVDGVIYDIEDFMFKYAANYFKDKYGLEVVNYNGYGIKEIFNCTDEQQNEFWSKYAIKYFLLYNPRKDIIDAINKLRAEGHRVDLFTEKFSADRDNLKSIIKLLFKTGLKIHKVDVDNIHIFFSNHYNNENVCDEEKLNFLKENHFDVVIEDKKGNITNFSKLTNVLCIPSKNNQGIKGENITTIHNGNDLYAQVKMIDNKINNSDSIFSTFVRLSKEEKMVLTLEELKEYYDEFIKYCLDLPFDESKINSGERNFWLISHLVRSTFNHKYHPQVIGKELIPSEKGRIFVSNHRGNKDFKLILSALDNVTWHPLIKKEILDEKAGLLFNLINSIYVDRKNNESRKNSTIEMIKYLARDLDLLIFPEGTYTSNLTTNDLGPFSGASAVCLSQALDKYIVPMAITDNYANGVSPICRIGEPIKVSIGENLDDANVRLWHIINDLVQENKESEKTKILLK